MTRWLLVIPPAIFAAMAGLFFAGMLRDDPDGLPSTFVGRPAPAVVIEPMSGKLPFTDATLRDGEVKLVNFWASWCAPCRVEHPKLTEFAAKGLPVYGINYKDNADNALSFLEELGDPYAGVGADITGRMALNWGVYGVPETYVIGGDGTILARIAGPVTQRIFDSQLGPALAAVGVVLPD